MAGISMRHLYKTYPGDVTAVNDCNLEIEDKEFVVLVGPSGCGKSTTLRMIAGLDEISKGELYIGDTLVNDVPPKDRNIAMVFQSYALYPHMSVYNNMAFALELSKTPKEEMDRRVRDAAKVLGIEHLLARKPKALSGGQRQRVALGRAMVRNPDVFLLDEPLSNLDAKLRASMRTELIKLHKQLGTTFVYVTHDQTEAMTMGDRIVVMSEGIVQQVDTPQKLYDSPCNIFVAGFIGSPQMNFLDSILNKDDKGWFLEIYNDRVYFRIDGIDENLEKYAGRAVKLGIRPENISDDESIVAANADSAIYATVEVNELMGSEVYLYLRYGDTTLTARVAPTTTSKTGDKIRVCLDMKKMHLFDSGTEEAIL